MMHRLHNYRILGSSKQLKKIFYQKSLFILYWLIARLLRWQMHPLFNKGRDKRRNIYSSSIENKDKFSPFFPNSLIYDFKKFLDTLLKLENFPKNHKPLEEFLSEDEARYLLCAYYEKFAILSKLEIAYAEDVAQYDM